MKRLITVACAAIFLVVVSMMLYNRSSVQAQSPPADIDWSNSALTSDQNGSIELGTPTGTGTNPTSGAQPYIDFHYGNGFSQDYNARVVNGGDGSFQVLVQRPNNGGPVTALNVKAADTQVNGGVAQGTGIKHARVTTCSPGVSEFCSFTFNWSGTAFADTNYTASCTLENNGTDILTIAGKSTTSLTLDVAQARSGGSGTPVADCIAMHD